MIRNIWLTIITITTITLTLLSISLVITLQTGIDQVVRSAERRIDLSVYFFPTATDPQIQSVVDAIKVFPGVTSVDKISKEDALAAYKASAVDSPELLKPLDAIGDNPFGASLTIRADSPPDYERVISELSKPQYQDLIEGEQRDYEANQQFIQNFTSFTNKVRYAAVAVSGLFAVIACLLLFNTMRVAIYTHRDEIAVMKLVGATNRFVRTPFLLEAAFYCLVATLLTAAIVLGSLSFGQPKLNEYFGINEVNLYGFFLTYGVLIFVAEFIFIFFLSVLSSFVAVRRYLRV